MSGISLLPPAVRTYVRGYVLRDRRLAAIRGAGIAAAFFLASMLLCCVADRFFHFSSHVRTTLLALSAVSTLFLFLKPLLRLARPEVDWLAAAERIEQQNPCFDQRLQTVASQLLGRGDYRGSDEMLEQLAFDLNSQAAADRPSRLLPARVVAGPWVLLLLLAGLSFALGRVDELNMPQLGLRFLTPWQSIPPVTTTRLAVFPGPLDLQQGTPARIVAVVERLGGGAIWLHVAERDSDDANWQKFPMTVSDDAPTTQPATRPATRAVARSDSDLHFAYTLTSVDRDLHYYVTAGDAISPTFALRVLRKPAIAEFRIHYTFPAHTGRPPLTVTNRDGRIEAPVGTEALITIVSTEPLQSALLSFSGGKQLMTRPSADSDVRTLQGSILVARDGKYEIDLITTRQQASTGPPTMEVRATVDRAPIVRIGNAGQTLRLSPGEILPVSYEALDDFGLESLLLRVQIGSAVPIEWNVPARPLAEPLPDSLREDRRRRDGVYDLDLATLPLAIGDIATLVLVARDSAGQTATSDLVQVLASPRSVGLDATERVAELETAAQLVTTLGDDLESASKALADSDQSRGTAGAASRASRRMSAAGSAAATVRRALVRAIGRDPSPLLSSAMMGWIDAAQEESAIAEGLFREMGLEPRASEAASRHSPRSRAPRAMLAQAAAALAEQARTLGADLKIAARGERAATVMADLDNLTALEKRLSASKFVSNADKPASDRSRHAVQRLQEDLAAAGKSLGLKASGDELKQKLKALINEEEALLKSRSRFDYLTVVRDWSLQIQRNSWQPITLDERLLAAAQAEAVRPGGDARIARDYNLAARAAAAIEAAADRSLPVPVSPGTAGAYVSAFDALAREHKTFSPLTDVSRVQEQGAVRDQAEIARRLMGQWAGDIAGNSASRQGAASQPAAVRMARAESAALGAGAASVVRNYEKSRSIDAELVTQVAAAGDSVTTRRLLQKAKQAMESAERLDTLTHRQQLLADQSADAGKEGEPIDAASWAAAQRQVADQIAASATTFSLVGGNASINGEPNNRDKAGGAYAAMQSRLAALPQQLADLLDADAHRRVATAQSETLRKEADAAPSEQKAALRRMAEMAEKQENELAGRVKELMVFTSPRIGQTLLEAMEPFASESSGARETLAGQLMPALKALAEQMRDSQADRSQTELAAGEARRAIDAVQRVLAQSQEELAQRDPLTSAKWYARAAADALSRKPPDFRNAEKDQRAARAALSRAWDQSVRYASVQRLSAVRTLRPSAMAPVDATASESPRATPGWGTLVRDWRRLRSRETDDVTGLLHDPEPPGYEAALKAYFEALGKRK